jgi:hypothetical protein
VAAVVALAVLTCGAATAVAWIAYRQSSTMREPFPPVLSTRKPPSAGAGPLAQAPPGAADETPPVAEPPRKRRAPAPAALMPTGSMEPTATGRGGGTAAGGSTDSSGAGGGAGGSFAGGGSKSGGGATGGAGGRGGTSTATDAGAAGDAGTTCGSLGESCASRPCCGQFLCLTSSGAASCYASFPPPPVDSGSTSTDAGASRDTRGASDTPADSPCPIPEGCVDAAVAVDAGSACPSAPPASGSTCVGQASCFYDVCPSTGRTQATCTAGKWVVETGACGEVSCQGNYTGGYTCPSGQVCLAKIGGARLISCIANDCGTGPASSDCSGFTAGCTPIFNLSSGVTYYCNTCPPGQTCG